MSNFYRMGLAVETQLPVRVQDMFSGASDFHEGSRRFYDIEMIGAASSTPLGTLADGITAIILDAVHVLLMVGGFMFMARTIFP